MTVEITIKDWTNALRGLGKRKYNQGSNYLRRGDDTFCCLGVLCDLVEPERWSIGLRQNAHGIKYFVLGIDSDVVLASQVLPDHLKHKFGIDESTEEALTQYNDSGQFTFEEIADIIDAHIFDGKLTPIKYKPK